MTSLSVAEVGDHSTYRCAKDPRVLVGGMERLCYRSSTMAPRKKSSSKQPNVGAWLGGNKGYVLSGSNTDTSAKADAGGGQAEAVRGELGLGAYAAGVGAAGAIGAGVAAVRSGRAAQAVNKETGKQVILHGSPVKNIKQLEPLSGGRFAPNVPQRYLYGLNPEAAKTENLGKFVGEYAKKGGRGMNLKVEAPGSVYVAKVSNKSVVNPQALGQGARLPIITSTGSAKVVREIPVAGLSEAALEKQILKAVKRAGARVPKKK